LEIALETIYKEMDTLGHTVDSTIQVKHLMEAVTHPPTKHILADIIFSHPDARKSLSLALGLVTTKVIYYDIVLGK